MISTTYDMNMYNCTIIRHIDGDTTWATVDLGFDVKVNLTFRWAGINAAERNTPEGREATRLVNEWLPAGTTCRISTKKDRREKYGRYLATFYDENGDSLNDRLVEMGYAVRM